MKKTNIILASVLVCMLSITLVLANENDNANPFEKMLEKLTEILEQLKIIAEKETNIEVNVEPPEVIVNPEIVLPDKECKWEKLNQQIGIGSPYTFVLIENMPYEEVRVISAKGQIDCWGESCDYLINDKICASASSDNVPSIPQGSSWVLWGTIDFCTDAFKEGLNTVSVNVDGEIQSDFQLSSLNRLYLEMEIKPANC